MIPASLGEMLSIYIYIRCLYSYYLFISVQGNTETRKHEDKTLLVFRVKQLLLSRYLYPSFSYSSIRLPYSSSFQYIYPALAFHKHPWLV